MDVVALVGAVADYFGSMFDAVGSFFSWQGEIQKSDQAYYNSLSGQVEAYAAALSINKSETSITQRQIAWVSTVIVIVCVAAILIMLNKKK